MDDHVIVLTVAAAQYWIRSGNQRISDFARYGREKGIGFASVSQAPKEIDGGGSFPWDWTSAHPP